MIEATGDDEVNGVDDRAARRWWAWLDGWGSRLQTGRRVVAHDRVEAGGEVPTEVFAWQVFARANAEERRSLDLLLVALIERSPADGSALVVVGPEALRAQTTAGPAGLTVTEMGLGPVGPGLRAVSLALVRVPRASRSRDVLASIEALGRLVDYAADPDGSAAVAHALMRRIEVLSSGPGVQVSVVGALRQPGAGYGTETLHLLADERLALDDDVELREGRLMVVTAGTSPAVPLSDDRGAPTLPPRDPATRRRRPWAGGDYVLVRVGRPAARRPGGSRPLAQRRMEHALAEVGPGADPTGRTDSYSSRVAAVRQATRAQQVIQAALAGDTAAAVRRLSSALTEPGAGGPLVDGLADEVNTVADFWLVAPVVRRARSGQGADASRAAALIEDRLGRELDQLLGLDVPRNQESALPIVTPIVVELSDTLVPIVDSRLDGGHFLDELVPAMRDRIRERTGVVVPGVRGRGEPSLPPGQYVIQIDEIPAVAAGVRVEGRYAVRSVAAEAVGRNADISEIHPTTGERGRWQIELVEEPADDDGTFSPADYLIHRLEREIQRSLRTMLGLQEVDALLKLWRRDDAALVGGVIDGPVAAQRLTVLLQELVTEQVPIAEWRTVLTAIADAGGMDTHLRVLQRAARLALRQWLPGLRSGPAAQRLPESIESALALPDPGAPPPTDGLISGEAWTAFSEWLNRSAEALGPVLTVITDDAEVRRRVAVLARREGVVVLTLTAEEMA